MPSNSTTTTSLLNPTEFEIDSLCWIWVALRSVAAQIPPPPPPVDPSTLSDEEKKEYDDKQKNLVPPPTVLEPQQMLIATMKRALDARDFKASCAEIVDSLLPSIHRACFPNADETDNRAAAAHIADDLEADLLRDNQEISLRDFAHVLYRRVVHPAGWLPPVDFVAFANEEAVDAREDGGRSVMGGGGGAASVAGDRRATTRQSRHLSTGTPRGQSAIAVATPLVKQFRDLAQCIIDAPNLTTEPRLLPLSRVLSLTTVFDNANKIPVDLTTFVDLDPQREYAQVYDDMWEAIVVSSNSDGFKAGFQEWFGLFLSFTIPNAMEERSYVAGAAHYDEAYAISSSFDGSRFRQLAQDLFRFYTKRLVTNISCVEHFEKMMNLVRGSITKRLEASESDIIAPVLEQLKFTTVDALYTADNMNAEDDLLETVYPSQTMNRVLVTGLEGLVSLDYCKQLAQRLNVEHIDVLELLIKAYDDNSSETSTAIRSCIDEEKPIPLELQASLVHAALNKESTKFRGYVFGELPPALEGDGGFVDTFLSHSGLCDARSTPPRVVVEAACPSSIHKSGSLYRVWRAKYRDQIAAVYSAELAIRDKEFADKEAKAAKIERKEAAKKRREEREENREKIARGELAQLSEEEQEHESHQDAEDQALIEEEDEVDPDTLDENGNLIDPDDLPKAKEAKAAAKKRRSDIAEIHRLYHASRTCDLSSPQNAAYNENASLGAIVETAKASTQKFLRVACFDAAETLVNFTCSQLQLHPTIVPRVSALPADLLAGYEPSPDADASTGEQFQQDLIAAGYRRSAYGEFCPVTKFEDLVLVTGTWFYSCSYREYCYCFASKEKLDKFAANPHTYLSQDVNSYAPVFLLQENFEVLEQAGISASELHLVLGERLKLSCRSLSNFADNWHRYDAEVARRAALEVGRKQSDAAERKDREARLKAAIAEAEAAAKKNARAGGAKAKTASPPKTTAATGVAAKGAKGAAAAAAVVEQQRREKELAEAHAKANAISDADQAEMQERLARAQAALVEHPVTTESRFANRVAAENKRTLTSMRPLIVSALESWNVDEVQTFRARHVLPDIVVCFQNIKPPVLDADGNPVVSEEDDASMNEDDDQQNNNNNNNQEDSDEDQYNNNNSNRNNSMKKKKSVVGSTDPSLDPKKSRHFWTKFLTELEEESQAVLGETGGVVPEHDGAPQQQPFRVVRVNVHDLTLDTVVDMVLYNIREIGFKCDPNAGGTELQVEDDEDDDGDAEDEDDEEYANLLANNPLIERRDPILRARPRAVHQFGETAIYCPVALVRDGLLVRGDPSIWTQLNGRKFIFATAANMEAFKLLPKRYIPASPPQPMPLPPPRVWLFGPAAAGKDTIADNLCKEFGLKRFSAEPETLLKILAAATDETLPDDERTIDGVYVPLQYPFAPAAPGKSNVFQYKHLAEAIKIKKELDEFAKDQDEKQKRKQAAEKDAQEREQWLDDGEEVEELSEAQQVAQQTALDWEAEDDEVKIERLASAHRRLASALSRIEPWATSGYLLVGQPTNDADLNGLLDAQMIPETTIRLTMGVEAYLERRFKDELATRQAEYQVKIRNFRMKQSALQLFARVAEITKWRRRNIGAEDTANLDPPELEDADNEPEPVDAEAVRADLEQKFEASVAEVDALVEILPDRRIPVVTIRGDDGLESVFASARQVLRRNLIHRASFLEHPQVITIDDANDRLEKVGRALFSAFGKEDPVILYERRNMNIHNNIVWAERISAKNKNQIVLEEPAYVEPEPEVAAEIDDAPKKSKKNKAPKERKTKIVEDDDGNEIEVTDHDADEDEADEEVAEPEPEPEQQEEEDEDAPVEDPFADLEEYPADLSPEEIEEMQNELNILRKKRADRNGRRACVLYNRIYFFDNDQSLRKFVTGNCRLYTEQPPPLPKVLGNVVAVQAHDDVLVDDKSRTIESIALNSNNAVFISVPKLVEWGCSQTHFARLQQEAIDVAIASEFGSDVPDGWIEEALACRLMSTDVQQNGCVLCNLPRTTQQLSNLLSHDRINTVLVFNASAEDSVSAPVSSVPSDNRFTVYTSELGQTIRAVREMSSAIGTSAALHEAAKVLSATLEARRRIIISRKLAFPLIADDAALEESFVLSSEARCPQYSYYCPWTWARESRLLERDPKSDLVQDPTCAPRKNVVEFLGKLYFFSDIPERIQEFLSYPERFIGERFRPKPLPDILPHRLVHDQSRSTASSSAVALDSIRDDQIELCGFCPVVLCDTRRNRGLMGLVEPKAVAGVRAFIAEYSGKFYSMSSEASMQRFLSEPWTIVDGAVLPAAAQFPQQGTEADLQSASLEMFLRRALRESVARAMCDVERIRPKFPGISVQQSALRFLALHIRAHHPDPRQSDFSLRVHAENYQQFVELATTAREGGLVPPAEDATPEVKEAFEKRCKMWDELLDNPQVFYERFSGLRTE